MHYLFQIADDYRGETPINLPGLGPLSQCVAINKCSKLLDNSTAPEQQILPCGFDQKQKLMKICCPPAYVTETEVESLIENKSEAISFYFVGYEGSTKVS